MNLKGGDHRGRREREGEPRGGLLVLSLIFQFYGRRKNLQNLDRATSACRHPGTRKVTNKKKKGLFPSDYTGDADLAGTGENDPKRLQGNVTTKTEGRRHRCRGEEYRKKGTKARLLHSAALDLIPRGKNNAFKKRISLKPISSAASARREGKGKKGEQYSVLGVFMFRKRENDARQEGLDLSVYSLGFKGRLGT